MSAEPRPKQLEIRDFSGKYRLHDIVVDVWVNPYIENNENGTVQFLLLATDGYEVGVLLLHLGQGVITGNIHGCHVIEAISAATMFEQVTEAAAVGYVLQRVLDSNRPRNSGAPLCQLSRRS